MWSNIHSWFAHEFGRNGTMLKNWCFQKPKGLFFFTLRRSIHWHTPTNFTRLMQFSVFCLLSNSLKSKVCLLQDQNLDPCLRQNVGLPGSRQGRNTQAWPWFIFCVTKTNFCCVSPHMGAHTNVRMSKHSTSTNAKRLATVFKPSRTRILEPKWTSCSWETTQDQSQVRCSTEKCLFEIQNTEMQKNQNIIQVSSDFCAWRWHGPVQDTGRELTKSHWSSPSVWSS